MRFFNLSTSEGKVFWIVIAAIIIVFAAKAIEPSGLSKEEIYQIAATNGQCKDNLTTDVTYNPDARAWQIVLDIDREGCDPICVVSEITKTAEIDWQCTDYSEVVNIT